MRELYLSTVLNVSRPSLAAEVQHGVVHAVVGLTLSRSLLQPLLISRFFF